jgi:hypothetical protein
MKYLLVAILVFSLAFISGRLHALEYQKNPYLAMLYSTLLPGGGQLYNRKYVKSAVVVGLQAWLISMAVNDNDKIEHYKDLMNGVESSDPAYLSYKSKRESYKEELHSDYWWIGTVLALSVADAFVDAHLYNYNLEKQKVQLKFEDKMLQLELDF